MPSAYFVTGLASAFTADTRGLSPERQHEGPTHPWDRPGGDLAASSGLYFSNDYADSVHCMVQGEWIGGVGSVWGQRVGDEKGLYFL